MNLTERNRLVEENQGLVKKIALNIARSIPPSSFDFDDLVGWGQIGLIEAAGSYDSKRYKFSVWAFLRIRGAMIDGMRSMDMFPRQIYGVRREIRNQSDELSSKLGRHPTRDEVAEALELTDIQYRDWTAKIIQMECMSADTGVGSDETLGNIASKEDEFQRWECSADILEALKLLKDRERAVVYYRYWVGLTQSEIADIMGVQPARVHQIIKDAMRSLRECLYSYGD